MEVKWEAVFILHEANTSPYIILWHNFLYPMYKMPHWVFRCTLYLFVGGKKKFPLWKPKYNQSPYTVSSAIQIHLTQIFGQYRIFFVCFSFYFPLHHFIVSKSLINIMNFSVRFFVSLSFLFAFLLTREINIWCELICWLILTFI